MAVICIGLLATAIFSVFPLKEVRPFTVNFADKSDVVATVLPITDEIGGFDALARSLAGQYVQMRHAYVLSGAEMERRWGAETGIIYLMSSPSVYRDFLKEALAISQKVQSNGLTVQVKILSISTITAGSKYQVEYSMEFMDKANRTAAVGKSFVSTLEVEFQAIKTEIGNRLINPTGFTVVGYTSVEKLS